MNATQTLTSLQAELTTTRDEKVTSTNNHNLALRKGIDTLKDLFGSVSEIKQLSEKVLIRTIQKRTNLKLKDNTKRVLKISHKLINGYKIKKELLTIAQIEQVLTFPKSIVNDYISFEDEDYLDEIKDLIKSAKVEKTTKVFSPKVARNK